MKRSIAFVTLAATLASFGAFADSGAAPAEVDYQYGMPLDVAKVISLTPASAGRDCQVGTAHMVYVDHQGQTHSVDYREMGTCSQQ
ncbi:DUF2790 domain-containing protein [Pseudomonas xanthosomatis]|uniref:DUF2790 domain-containing protein n=1 Tax=Pseudomonas xanthosomatis TaxID=2842356 RepID=UPI00351767DB